MIESPIRGSIIPGGITQIPFANQISRVAQILKSSEKLYDTL